MVTERRGSLVADPAPSAPVPSARPRPVVVTPQLPAGHAVLHVLDRCAFGPTPELVAEVLRRGPREWLEQQLDPAAVDHDCDARVRRAFPATAWDAPRILDSDEIEQWQCGLVLRLATLQRAVHARRQLFEVMVWFWSNHLNVFPGDGGMQVAKLVEDREVVRRHALGRFEDMLVADARSPAMLLYLDNESSRAPDVNENYARELLELHTLGVDGGYTEVDVRAAAGVLAGLTVDRRSRRYRFEPAWQDPRAVRVLDLDVPAGRGEDRAITLLRHLANHPSTARHLARKLCTFLVGPQASTGLVERVAAAYLRSGTDIPTTLRAVFADDEFWTARGTRLQPPFFAFARALRALRADLGLADGLDAGSVWQLTGAMERLGQPPFGWHPPNGYPDVDAYWTSPGLLVHRWNTFALLARGKVHGTRVDHDALLAGVTTLGEAVERYCAVLTCRLPTAAELAVLHRWVGDVDMPVAEAPRVVVEHLAALVLSLPSSQRR